MKVNREIPILILLLVAVSFVFSAGFSLQAQTKDKPINLTYAFFAPAHTFPGKQMAQWAAEVENRMDW